MKSTKQNIGISVCSLVSSTTMVLLNRYSLGDPNIVTIGISVLAGVVAGIISDYIAELFTSNKEQ